MNGNRDQIASAPSAKPRETFGILSGFIHGIWVTPGVATLIVILFLVLGHARLHEVGIRFVGALVYSALIGIPSSMQLSWIGFRYSERLGRAVILLNTLALIGTTVFGCLAAGLVFQVTGLIPHHFYWAEFRESFPFALMVTLIVGLSLTSFETMRYKLQAAAIKLRTQEIEQERAYKLLAEARLSSLESRIHPHFLFNTLNSIAALIPMDPKRAEATVGKLASLLRFSLNANQTGLAPLAQEVKIVRDYLEIESTRFSSRLRYSIDIPEALQDVKTPPLALQCLVENSVKHVVAQRAQGGEIRLAATRGQDMVQLEVIDDGPGFTLESITPEHGLGNLVGRLELLFGDRARLTVARRDEMTVVGLVFPIE
jgi:two-component system, LytTR family, sensor histidine kinase AlgZ